MRLSLFSKIITYELMINTNKFFNIFIVNVHEHFLNILRGQSKNMHSFFSISKK